jgi:hypothetical protein
MNKVPMKIIYWVLLAFLVIMFGAVRGEAAPIRAQPEGATSFVISALKRFPVVELGHVEGPGDQNELELLHHMLGDPSFIGIVNDIVIECGNSRYQHLLDSYVAGGNVTLQQVQVVWRKTTQLFGCESDPTAETLVNEVRDINLRATQHRLRVLAADPPIDWNAIHTSDQFKTFLSERDQIAASVIQRQVLVKHRRALVIMGGGHLTKRPPFAADATVTTLLDRRSPVSTYVIYGIDDYSRFDRGVRRMLATWTAPVIAAVAGTNLGSQSGRTITSADTMRRVGSRWIPVDNAYPGDRLQQLVDAILYLGPQSDLRSVDAKEPTDQPYAAELQRIRAIAMGKPIR